MTNPQVRPASPNETDVETEPVRPLLPGARAPEMPAPVGLAREEQRRPRSLEQAESAYLAARGAWLEAMRAANGGRTADLASLALAQEAYEAAAEERERWLSGERVAIAVEPRRGGTGIDAIVRQEMAWRKVHEIGGQPEGRLRRLLRRLGGR